MKVLNYDVSTDIYDIIDKLREDLRLSGSNLLEIDPKESGDYLLVQCPFHKDGQERHPSAQIRKEDGLFYCHNCKEVHSLPDLISYCLKTNGKQWLMDNFDVTNPNNRRPKLLKGLKKDEEVKTNLYIPREELKKYRFVHPYMYERKLTLDIIRKFDIGYDSDFTLITKDKNGNIIKESHIGECITFPNKDQFGNILFIARRAINMKFFNYPRDVDKPVYGLYEIYREIKHGVNINKVYVCESMLDALAIWSWGKYAIALNGTGSAYQYDILNKCDIRMFILATDNDKAGKLARERFKEHIKNKFIREIDYTSYKDCKDINEFTEEQFLNAKIIK